MESVRFSLIVPTRERIDTLRFCLQTLTTQTYQNLEIIVSDNASTDGTEAYVKSLSDPRIRYVNTGKRVGMSQNWEFALNHATGEWIAFLGDDDGLLPGCFEKIDALIAKTNAKAIRTRACSYVWPNAQPEGRGTAMNIPLGRSIQIRKSSYWIEKTLNGSANYSELPMIYNGGFIQKAVLDSFSGLHGKTFFSQIPDVFSGLLIASLIAEYVYSSEPVVVNGTSASSTGFSHFKKALPVQEAGNITSPSLIFTHEDNLSFHPTIPLMRNGEIPKSIQALIFESYAQVVDRIKAIEAVPPEKIGTRVLEMPHTMRPDQMSDWLDDFYRIHQLPDAARPKLSKFRAMKYVGRFLIYRFNLVFHSYFVDTQRTAICNIYQASLLARKIYDKQPFHIFNALKHSFRLLLLKKF